MEKELRVEFVRLEEKAAQPAIRNGLEFHPLPAEEKDAWQKVSAPLRTVYIKNAGDIGVELILAAEALRDGLTHCSMRCC